MSEKAISGEKKITSEFIIFAENISNLKNKKKTP